MKLKKLLFGLISIFFVAITTHSQELINLVPDKSTFIGVIDLNQINSKASFDELIKLPLVEKMDKEISKELFRDIAADDTTSYLNLKKYGISVNKKSYFYVKNSDNVFYGALIFALDDEAKFTKFAEMVTKTEDGKQTVVASNYKYTNKNKLRIVWNSKFAAFYGVTISPVYKDSVQNSILYPSTGMFTDSVMPYNDEVEVATVNSDDYNTDVVDTAYEEVETVIGEPTDETEETEIAVADDYAVADTTYNDSNYSDPYSESYTNEYTVKYAMVSTICDSIENAWSAANMGIFVQDKGANSLAANKEFMDYIKTNPDVACMFDYGQFMNITMGSFLGAAAYGMSNNTFNNLPYKYMQDFYNGLSMYSKVELKQGAVNFSFDMKHNDKINEIYKEIKKTNISKNLIKYLNNDVMGYYAVGVDIPGMSKGLGSVLEKIYPTIPQYGNIVSSAIDVIDIFIDEQAIYNIFTGDAVFAINGVKPVEVILTTYDYDENFNSTEVLDTTMQMQPEVLFMAGVGNVADVNKILKLLISLDVLKKEGNLYALSIKHADLPVFIKIQDDILFISNNRAYVENPQVYAKDKQLNKEHAKMFKENSFVAYANTSKIAQYFAKQGKTEDEKILTQAAELFKSVKMLGKNKNGYTNASCVFELSKSNNNSVIDIIKFLNELYLLEGKKL